jgi:membrane fusion protein (multidrug efflux system)
VIKENQPSSGNHKRKKIAFGIFSLLALLGALTVYFYLEYKRTHITTDDAFIEGSKHTIGSKVPGTVMAVWVKDNQLVKKGDLLLEIDPQDYDLRVRETKTLVEIDRSRLVEAKSRVDLANRQSQELKAALAAAQARQELQEANLKQAEWDIQRAETLVKKEVIPKERHEKTRTAYQVAKAQVKVAREEVTRQEKGLESHQALIRQAEAAIPPIEAQIRQKQTLIQSAELNRSYTKIIAPSDGYVTRKSVEVGNQIQASQPLMALVSPGPVWVIANYKETQLEKVRPGQKVIIRVDTYPDREFKGRVESLMAGTGAVFSLFPPENATGNYVKVVQRIPVKILLETGTDPNHFLRVGLSVVPTILVEEK